MAEAEASERRGSEGVATAAGEGLVSIGAGVALAVWPGVTLLVVSQIMGWVMIISAVAQLARALRRRGEPRRWLSRTVVAVVTAGLGLALVVWPGRTILVVTVLAGAWLILDGMSRPVLGVASDSPRAEILGNVLGIVQAVIGLALIVRPVAGLRATALFGGAGLVVFGATRLWPRRRASHLT